MYLAPSYAPPTAPRPRPNVAAPSPPTAAPPALPKLRAVGKAEAPALAPSNAPPARAASLLPLAGTVCVLASDLPTPAAKAPPAPAARPMAAGIATSGATTAPTAPPNTSNAPVSASKGVMSAVSSAACSATNCSMSWAATLWISCALCPACSMTRCASVGRPMICGNTRCSTAFAALVAFLKPKFCAAWPTPPAPAAMMLVSPAAAAALADAAAEAAAGLDRRIEAISPVSFVLRVCVEPRLQKTGALQMRERSALIAIVGGFEVVLDGRSQLSVRPWIFGQRLCGLREFVQVEVAGSVDAGVVVGQRDAERRLAFFDVFQHLREARTHSEAEGSLFFHVLSTGARPAAARLGALAAAPRRPTEGGGSYD